MIPKQPKNNNQAQQLLQSHKWLLDLVQDKKLPSGYGPAVDRIFGISPVKGKVVRIGNLEFRYSGFTKKLVSFLPLDWCEELDRTRGIWSGCEKWWAGYPLILWIELRSNDDGTTGFLKLDAEIGPVSPHKVRKNMINAISSAASAAELPRIHFPVGSTDEGRLYSRFLRENTVAVDDVNNTNELEFKTLHLLGAFELEFRLVFEVLSAMPGSSQTLA